MKLTVLIVAIAIFCSAAPSARAQWTFMKSDGDSLLQLGIQNIYNVQFNEAHDYFQKVIDLYPDHPSGYFLDAMIEWWKINIDRKNMAYDAAFLSKIDHVLGVCNKVLANDKTNITSLFFKGGALGFRGRYYASRERMLDAANDGKDALDILIACQKIAPGNHDIMLGTGLYNYFAAVLPEKYPLLKPVMVFFPSGDKTLGILQLKAAAQKARYAKVEAQVVLYQVYYDFEKSPTEALPYARELYARFPRNPYFHRAFGRCLVTEGSLDTLELLWRDVLLKVLDKNFGYDKYAAREALYYIGVVRMLRGDYAIALIYLYKADEACRALDEDPSGFMVKANLKIGQILDFQGNRQAALKQYEKVLSWKDTQGSHAEAQRFVQAPYK